MARDGIEIETDPRFQKRTWRWQRAGWVGFAAIIALGALGLFGAGPIASATWREGGVPSGSRDAREIPFG